MSAEGAGKSGPADGAGVSVIREGAVEIKVDSSRGVFYNPVQCLNRDLSVVMIKAWCEEYFIEKGKKLEKQAKGTEREPSVDESPAPGLNMQLDQSAGSNGIGIDPANNIGATESRSGEDQPAADGTREAQDQDLEIIDLSKSPYKDMKISILEALSATGLRALRYAKEITNISRIVANDISPEAFETISENIKSAGVEGIVEARRANAIATLYESLVGQRYDVIDIDPYGSAAPFIDAAVQAVSNGGLLLITCTDMAVLAGPHRAACWSKYGGITVPNMPYHQEMALRLVLNTIQTSALRYKRTIEPLVSISVDFYVRLLVRIWNSSKASSSAPEKFSMVYHCPSCKSFTCKPISKPKDVKDTILPPDGGFSSKCIICDSQRQLGGPFYSGAIHSSQTIRRAIRVAEKMELKTKPHILGILNMALKELSLPFYWSIAALTNTVHVNQPQLKIFGSALLNAGYEVSISHCATNSLKTNAPASFIWDIMRTWVETNPVSKKYQDGNSPASVILSKPVSHEIDMSFNKKINVVTSRDPRHQSYRINPEKNWGPMSRPKKMRKTSPSELPHGPTLIKCPDTRDY